MAKKEQWSSRAGFLLSAVGSAVGLGNIWRFPYQAYENGGGAFLIPYFVAVLTAGIPLMVFEFSLGHRMRSSLPTIFQRLSKRRGYRSWEWIGWFQPLLALFIATFYAVILSWVFYYLGLSFFCGWGDRCESFFFAEFLQTSSSPFEFGGINPVIWLLTAFIWFLIWLIVFRGIRRGIERVGKIFMPILAVLILILMVYQLFQPGAAAGLDALFKPDFKRLTDINLWIHAYGQVFFSMSLGFGTMITYASYLPKESDIVNNAFLTGLLDCAFSLVSGILIFSTLGSMAFLQNSAIAEVVQGGPSLTFVTIPEVLNRMPAAPLFGPLFFISLAIAGLSSVISLIEPMLSALTDRFAVSRRKGATVIALAGCAFSTLFTFRSGILTLDIADFFASNFGILTGGLSELILTCWILKPDFLAEHANLTSDFRVGRLWKLCVSFLTPFILFIILSMNISQAFAPVGENYGGYSFSALFVFGWLTMGALIVLSQIIQYLSGKRTRVFIEHLWEEKSSSQGESQ